MPPLPFESFHVYELRPGLPDQFVVSITSATYVSRLETQQITVVPLRDFRISYDHPLLVIVDPSTNPGVETIRPLAAYISAVQSLLSEALIPFSKGEVSEEVRKEMKLKLNGWLDL